MEQNTDQLQKQNEKTIYHSPADWFQLDKPLIFLDRLSGEDALKASNVIHTLDSNMCVALPINSSIEDEGYSAADNWDTYHIRLASNNGVVVFWCNKNSDINTLLFNLGEWLQNLKYRRIYQPERPLHLLLGIEPGFALERYLRFRIGDDLPEFKIYDNLNELCIAAVGKITTKIAMR